MKTIASKIILTFLLILNSLSSLLSQNSALEASLESDLINYVSPFSNETCCQALIEFSSPIEFKWDSLKQKWILKEFVLPQTVTITYFIYKNSQKEKITGTLKKVNEQYGLYLKKVIYHPIYVNELPKKGITSSIVQNVPIWNTEEIGPGCYMSSSLRDEEQLALFIKINIGDYIDVYNKIQYDFSPMFKSVGHKFNSSMDEFIMNIKADNTNQIVGKTIIAKASAGKLGDYGIIIFDKNSSTVKNGIISSW